MIERKCLQCGTWNNEEDYCKNCNAALSPKAVDKEKEAKWKAENPEIPTKFDLFLKRAKNSKYLLVRILYKILYSIGVFMGLIGALFAWMAALANG